MPVSDVTVVLLAGGQGTRIRALYPDSPKPMVPVAGRPFLHWVTAYFARARLAPLRLFHRLPERADRGVVRDGSMPGLVREVCREQTPLGTGGGLLNCLEKCGPWILVANGDSLCLGGMPELLSRTEPARHRRRHRRSLTRRHVEIWQLDIDVGRAPRGFPREGAGARLRQRRRCISSERSALIAAFDPINLRASSAI